MPPSLREWLPEGHLAWLILAAVEEMDLSGFYGAYRIDGHGRPAHDPAMMVALLLYGYAKGQRSSRGSERACVEDVAFRVIAANEVPGHTTIARFRQRHEAALAGLFGEVLGAVRVGWPGEGRVDRDRRDEGAGQRLAPPQSRLRADRGRSSPRPMLWTARRMSAVLTSVVDREEVSAVLKSVIDRDPVETRRATMRGEPFVYPGAVRALIRDYLARVESGENPASDPLSPRESEVLKLIAEGHTSKEIAELPVISEKTVERHRANLLDKLGLRNRVELTRYAIRRGVTDP